MSETKADVEAQRDALAKELEDARAENDRLRGELTAATATAAQVKPSGEHQAAQRQPYLSEAERQELELRGVTTSPFTGRQVTRDEALKALRESEDQKRVEIAEPSGALATEAKTVTAKQEPVYGVTHVFPSVAPGVLADEARVDSAGNARLPGNVVG